MLIDLLNLIRITTSPQLNSLLRTSGFESDHLETWGEMQFRPAAVSDLLKGISVDIDKLLPLYDMQWLVGHSSYHSPELVHLTNFKRTCSITDFNYDCDHFSSKVRTEDIPLFLAVYMLK